MRLFDHRWLFTGSLVLTSGLHIGGGRTTTALTDSPVVRTVDGRPYVPGSSFKGAFRSAVEKLAGNLPAVRTCASLAGQRCAGPQGPDQQEFNRRRREEAWNEARLAAEMETHLCDTCKLFGSPFAASKVLFSDLYPPAGAQVASQVRDGVGIDRDSERAASQIKFDFEVVEVGTGFDLEIIAENLTDVETGLVCLGLAEFQAGMGGIGGLRSRGLGSCRLERLRIYELDLRDEGRRADRLRTYLLGRGRDVVGGPGDRMDEVTDVKSFLERCIDRLFEEKGN